MGVALLGALIESRAPHYVFTRGVLDGISAYVLLYLQAVPLE